MDKILTLVFMIILLLILVVPKFVEDANIVVIFMAICIVVSKILFFGRSKKQNTNQSTNSSNADNEKDE